MTYETLPLKQGQLEMILDQDHVWSSFQYFTDRHSTTSLGSLFLVLTHPHSKKSHVKRNFMCFSFCPLPPVLSLDASSWFPPIRYLFPLRSLEPSPAEELQLPCPHGKDAPARSRSALVLWRTSSASLHTCEGRWHLCCITPHACTTCHVPIKRLKPQRY